VVVPSLEQGPYWPLEHEEEHEDEHFQVATISNKQSTGMPLVPLVDESHTTPKDKESQNKDKEPQNKDKES
jgi:hypothetical protein